MNEMTTKPHALSEPLMKTGEYQLDVLVQGYPGRSVCHGGLGWSTIALLRGRGRIACVQRFLAAATVQLGAVALAGCAGSFAPPQTMFPRFTSYVDPADVADELRSRGIDRGKSPRPEPTRPPAPARQAESL